MEDMKYQELYGEITTQLDDPKSFEKMICDHLGTDDIAVFAGNGCDFDFTPDLDKETNGAEVLRDHVGDEIRFAGDGDNDGWIYDLPPTPRTAILELGEYKSLPYA